MYDSWVGLDHRHGISLQEMLQIFLFPTQEEAQSIGELQHVLHLSPGMAGGCLRHPGRAQGAASKRDHREAHGLEKLYFLKERYSRQDLTFSGSLF